MALCNPNPKENIFCSSCLNKTPPVETILKIGVNITEYRMKVHSFTCNNCYKEKQKRFSDNIHNGIWKKIEREKEELDLQQFAQEWNDAEFKGMKEVTPNKLVKCLSKYIRRRAEDGFKRDTMCEVMYPDLWYVTVERVIEDFLNTRNDSPVVRARHKEFLYLYIPQNMDAFTEHYRSKARNRFTSLKTATNKQYAGMEKFVCAVAYRDGNTKRSERRYFLLSYKDELERRDQKHKAQQEGIDRTMIIEEDLVSEHEKQKEEYEKKKQVETQSDKEQQGGEQ